MPLPKENYSQLSVEQLDAQIAEQRDALQRLRINHAVSQLENPNVIWQTKKTIARLLTEKHQRGVSLQPQKSTAAHAGN